MALNNMKIAVAATVISLWGACAEVDTPRNFFNDKIHELVPPDATPGEKRAALEAIAEPFTYGYTKEYDVCNRKIGEGEARMDVWVTTLEGHTTYNGYATLDIEDIFCRKERKNDRNDRSSVEVETEGGTGTPNGGTDTGTDTDLDGCRVDCDADWDSDAV